MSATYPRLQRIALEPDLVADTAEDWPAPSRTQLHALARQVAEFDPTRPIEGTLTAARSRLLAFLRQFFACNGHAPTRREISQGLGFASDNASLEHLRRLEQKGVVTLFDGHRGIRLTTSKPMLGLEDGHARG